MSERNLCAVLYGKNDLRLEERKFLKKPGKGEVLLSVQSVSVCGSDVHFWVDGNIGDAFILDRPMILGHESSGCVVAVGDGVTHIKPGERVAMEPGIPCRHCSYCKSGRYHLCPDMKFGSAPPVDGYLTQYLIHPADFCFKLPDHVSYDEGAMLEPLSVGVWACERAGIGLGSKVLICGVGPIGLICMLAAIACGATDIIVTDLDAGRLEKAKTLGATHTVQVTSKDSRQLADKIIETLGCPPDKTIECSGAQSSIATGIYATASGGVLVLVGLGLTEAKLPIVDASIREVDIRGVFRYCNSYPKALDLVASGRVNVKPLITHHYSLKEVGLAFKRAKTGEDGAIKVMVHCNEE